MKKSLSMIVLGVIFLISGFYFLQKKEGPEIVTIIQDLPIKAELLEKVDDRVAKQLLDRIIWVNNKKSIKSIKKIFFNYRIKPEGILFFWRNQNGGWLEGYIEKFKTPKTNGVYFYGQPEIKMIKNKLELRYTIHHLFSTRPLAIICLTIGSTFLMSGLTLIAILKKYPHYPFF